MKSSVGHGHHSHCSWQLLADQIGAKIRVGPMNDRGELLWTSLPPANERTRIVSIVHLSNSLGT